MKNPDDATAIRDQESKDQNGPRSLGGWDLATHSLSLSHLSIRATLANHEPLLLVVYAEDRGEHFFFFLQV